MNKILIIALLLFAVSFSEAQLSGVGAQKARTFPVRQARTGTLFSSWSYVAQTDTMQPVDVDSWINTYYDVEVKDSASVTVSYMPSYDGVTFYPAVTIDSLSSANNAGNAKSFALPSGAAGLRAVKFVRAVNSFRLGTTSPTAKEKIIQVR